MVSEEIDLARQKVPMKGASIIQTFRDAGVRTVVSLPDIVTCESILWPISKDSEFQLVPICKEDEGVSICAGLSYCNHRAVLLIQHTGFLDSINAIRAIAVEYQLPIVMFVGLQGMEDDRMPEDSNQLGIRMLQPTCDAMGLDVHVLTNEEHVAPVAALINSAFERSYPVVFLIARSPS